MTSPIKAKFARVCSSLAVLGLLFSSGCASFKLKDAPTGFIEVSSSSYDNQAELRMKAPDNVGLNLTTFSNFRGGTLAIWAEDLVKKLRDRNYVLERQEPVESRNGVEGTRFDFRYQPPGDEQDEKFYTAVLFVTDEYRVVVQLAGKAELASTHAGDLDKILRELKVRGCKVASKVCNSGQPRQFETSHQPKVVTSDDTESPGGEAKADEQAPETPAKAEADEPADEPDPEAESQP